MLAGEDAAGTAQQAEAALDVANFSVPARPSVSPRPKPLLAM